MDDEWFGRLAYTAYGTATDNKNYQGNEMPDWYNLPDNIRHAWVCAAQAVIDNHAEKGNNE